MAAYLGSYSIVLKGQEGLFRVASLVAGFGVACAFVFAVLLFLTESVDVLPTSAVTYLIEWVAFLSFAFWMLLTGIQLRKIAPTS